MKFRPVENSDDVDREDAINDRWDVTQFALAHSMESWAEYKRRPDGEERFMLKIC